MKYSSWIYRVKYLEWRFIAEVVGGRTFEVSASSVRWVRLSSQLISTISSLYRIMKASGSGGLRKLLEMSKRLVVKYLTGDFWGTWQIISRVDGCVLFPPRRRRGVNPLLKFYYFCTNSCNIEVILEISLMMEYGLTTHGSMLPNYSGVGSEWNIIYGSEGM